MPPRTRAKGKKRGGASGRAKGRKSRARKPSSSVQDGGTEPSSTPGGGTAPSSIPGGTTAPSLTPGDGTAPRPEVVIGEEADLLNAKDVVVGRGILFAGEDGKLLRKLHGHPVATLQMEGGKSGEEYVVVRVIHVSASHAGDPYPYHMEGAEVPKKLSDIYVMNNYIWDLHRLRKVRKGSKKAGEQTPPPSKSIPGQETEGDDLTPIEKFNKACASEHRGAEARKSPLPRDSSPHRTPMEIEKRPGELLSPEPLAEERSSTVPTPTPPIEVTGLVPVSSSGPRNVEVDGDGEGRSSPVDGSKGVNNEMDVEQPAPSMHPPSRDTESEAQAVTTADNTENATSTHGEDIRNVADDSGNYTDEENDRLTSTVANEEDIVGVNEEDVAAEGPVDIIDVPYTRSRDTYNRTLIRIRIDQLIYPPNVTSELDIKHVGMLKSSLREDGVDYSLDYISVCYKPSERPFTPAKYPRSKFDGIEIDDPEFTVIDGKKVPSLVAYYVINGMHRGHALDRLFAEAVVLRDRNEYGVINVMLFSRKDGQEMTFYELLAIGGGVNDTGTVTKRPTFADQIQLCISCIREIRRLKPNINLTSFSLGKKFKEDAIVRANHEGTHQRYARAALTFADNIPLHRLFKDYCVVKRTFGITNFQCSSFHRALNSEEQLIALDALYEYLMQPTSGSFTYTAGTYFFMEIRQLLDVVADFAKRKEEPVPDFLKESVQITKNNTIPVSSHLIRTVCRFQEADKVLQMQKKSTNRIRRFKSILSETFFPKTEEEKRAEAEAARRLAEEKKKKEEERRRSRRVAKTRARAVTAQMMSQTVKVTGKRKKSQAKKKKVKQARYDTEPGVDFSIVVKDVLPFDDEIPARYPNRYNSRPSKWNGQKDWVGLLTVAPHRIWSNDMCVRHPEPWLHGMGVPRKHRSHIFLSAQDLQRNHHAVYYHAALQAARSPSILRNVLYKTSEDDTEDPLSSAKKIASRYPGLCESYLAKCREDVMNKGYCVIEGIFNDTIIPPGNIETVYDHNPANKVAELYASRFPTEEEMKNPHLRNKYWDPIFNNSADAAKIAQDTGQGRFSTTKDGLYKHTEMNDDTVEIARYRSALDVRALQICVAMGLEEACPNMLAIPCTGSRLLASTPSCERQLAHCDFVSYADGYDNFVACPITDYSVIWTADDPFPLILWENSHILQCGTRAATKKIEETLQAKRIVVPPFSCVVFRGDLLHTGPGSQDRTAAEKEALHHSSPIRFHIDVIRWGMESVERNERTTDAPFVPDNVFFVDKFQPMVQKDPAWISQNADEDN